jgi:hypothetical protein
VERMSLFKEGKMKREDRHKVSLVPKPFHCKQEGTIMPAPRERAYHIEHRSPNGRTRLPHHCQTNKPFTSIYVP